MTTTVTESRPAKHGKASHHKRVIIWRKDKGSPNHLSGEYIDGDKDTFAIRMVEPIAQIPLIKKEWLVEEIIERVE